MNYNFRQYTGLARTPSSLKWLLLKRARTLGLLEKKKNRKAKLSDEIDALRTQMKAIDQVIRQHEAKVDPEVSPGRRPHRAWIAGHGQMTRSIFEQLREANGQPRTTNELAIQFLQSIGKEVTEETLKDVRQHIRYRLKNLVRRGDVRPLHELDAHGFCEQGLWALKNDDD